MDLKNKHSKFSPKKTHFWREGHNIQVRAMDKIHTQNEWVMNTVFPLISAPGAY